MLSSVFAQDITLPNVRVALEGRVGSIRVPVEEKDVSFDIAKDSLRSKKRLAIAAHVAYIGGGYLLLSQAWYNQTQRTSFHLFDDSREWLQVDKVGHAWSAYNTARISTGLWRKAGYAPTRSAMFGTATSVTFLTMIEYLDSKSAKWGWSWADMGANIGGNAIFLGQEALWGKQKVLFKFSSSPRRYSGDLERRATELFGSPLERVLKDYNRQHYWLSASPRWIFPKSGWPAWLNIAVGYGAAGMWGGFENRAFDKNGVVTFDRRDILRQRQWLLSPDIDWRHIKTRKKGVRFLLDGLNMIKIPAPALKLKGGRMRVRGLVF